MASRITPTMPWLPYAFLGVSLVGFLDATYLTIKHFTHAIIPCSLTHGCEAVTTSVYSQILGIPVALLGAAFYLVILIGTFVALESGSRMIFRTIARLTAAGMLASVWFVFVQLVLVKAICQWCMASALTSTVLFILGYIVAPRALKANSTPTPLPPSAA